jgi:hypothetical protein
MKYKIKKYGILIDKSERRKTKDLKEFAKEIFDLGYMIKQRPDEGGDMITMICSKHCADPKWKEAAKAKENKGDPR